MLEKIRKYRPLVLGLILAALLLSPQGQAQVNTGIARVFTRYATASAPACSSSTIAFVYYDTTDSTAKFCNGSSYRSMDAAALSTLDSLSDVTITSAATNDVLAYNGSAWVNTSSVLKIVSFEGASADGSTGSFALDKCPSLTAGAATVTSGTNVAYTTLNLDAATDEGGCGSFVLPTGVTAIDLAVEGLAAEAGTNVARISIAGICVGAGETFDPSYNTAQTFAWTNTGTSQRVTATQTSLTITGCVATERYYFKFFRDGDGTSGTDSLGVDLRVVAVRFSVR